MALKCLQGAAVTATDNLLAPPEESSSSASIPLTIGTVMRCITSLPAPIPQAYDPAPPAVCCTVHGIRRTSVDARGARSHQAEGCATRAIGSPSRPEFGPSRKVEMSACSWGDTTLIVLTGLPRLLKSGLGVATVWACLLKKLPRQTP